MGSASLARRGMALSARELEALRLRALGYPNKQVAAHMRVARSTACDFIKSALVKLDAMTVIESFAALGWLRVPGPLCTCGVPKVVGPTCLCDKPGHPGHDPWRCNNLDHPANTPFDHPGLIR